MSEMLACLQLGALLWIAIGFGVLLWVPGAVLGRIQAGRQKRRQDREKTIRLGIAESYWREGLMVWLSPDGRRSLAMDVSHICSGLDDARQPKGEIPTSFLKAFEEKAG